MFARREWERSDQAPSMSSVPKALSRAAHLMHQRSDGTKRLKHVNLRHSQPIGLSGQAPRQKLSRRSGVDQTSFGAMDLRWRIFGGSGHVDFLKSQLSTVHRVFCNLKRRMPYA